MVKLVLVFGLGALCGVGAVVAWAAWEMTRPAQPAAAGWADDFDATPA